MEAITVQEQNKILIRSFLEKSNTERRTINELCDSDFIAHIGAIPTMDLKTFSDFQNSYYAAFTDNSIQIEVIITEDDIVAFRGTVKSKHTGSFAGIPATGNIISVPVIGMGRIKNGKIAEWWNSPDRLSWMQQIGAV
jgi:steroid delta-isomerase-like uncharacterized protein